MLQSIKEFVIYVTITKLFFIDWHQDYEMEFLHLRGLVRRSDGTLSISLCWWKICSLPIFFHPDDHEEDCPLALVNFSTCHDEVTTKREHKGKKVGVSAIHQKIIRTMIAI